MQIHKNQPEASGKQPNATRTKQRAQTCTCKACKPKLPELPAGMRRLKIQQKFVTKIRSWKTVPAIMLTGEWLRKLGFEHEDHIIIVEKEKQLIICVDETC